VKRVSGFYSSVVRGPAAADGVPPPLAPCGEADEAQAPSVATRLLTSMAEAAVADLKAQYQVGCAIHELRYPAPGESPDARGLAALGKRLGLDPSALRRRARVTETIGPHEFAMIVELRSARGLPLTWSHLEVLSTVRSRARREAIAREVAEGELSVRQCSAMARAAVAEARQVGAAAGTRRR
jgi:hypothetical protein